jgi:hypothetical protein
METRERTRWHFTSGEGLSNAVLDHALEDNPWIYGDDAAAAAIAQALAGRKVAVLEYAGIADTNYFGEVR